MKIEDVQRIFSFFNDEVFSNRFQGSASSFYEIGDLWRDAPSVDIEKKLKHVRWVQSQLDSSTPTLGGLAKLVGRIYTQDLKAVEISKKMSNTGITFLLFFVLSALSIAFKATLIGILLGTGGTIAFFAMIVLFISHYLTANHEANDRRDFEYVANEAMRENRTLHFPTRLQKVTQTARSVYRVAKETVTGNIDTSAFFDQLFKECASIGKPLGLIVTCKDPYNDKQKIAYSDDDVVETALTHRSPWFKIEASAVQVLVERQTPPATAGTESPFDVTPLSLHEVRTPSQQFTGDAAV